MAMRFGARANGDGDAEINETKLTKGERSERKMVWSRVLNWVSRGRKTRSEKGQGRRLFLEKQGLGLVARYTVDQVVVNIVGTYRWWEGKGRDGWHGMGWVGTAWNGS